MTVHVEPREHVVPPAPDPKGELRAEGLVRYYGKWRVVNMSRSS